MAQWTIVSKERSDTSTGTPKSFSVMLNTDNQTWSGFGEHVGTFLSVTTGKYTFQQSGELGLKLLAPNGKWQATFAQLLASSPVGATGKGNTELKNFDWRLDSK